MKKTKKKKKRKKITHKQENDLSSGHELQQKSTALPQSERDPEDARAGGRVKSGLSPFNILSATILERWGPGQRTAPCLKKGL